MSKQAVAIVGIGAQTTVGRTAEMTAAALRSGICRLHEHPFEIDSDGEPVVVSMADYLLKETQVAERMIQLALPAARTAVQPIRDCKKDIPTRVIVGLPENRPGLPPDLAANFADRLGNEIDGLVDMIAIDTVEAGHAAGLVAMERAWKIIRDGKCEVCLIGGADSYMSPDTFEWLEENDQLHNESNPWGFVPGEAAGFCVLASSRIVREHGLTSLANISSVSVAKEPNRIKTESVCVGEGLTKAWKNAVRLAKIEPGQIAESICDMNGEPYRADEMGFSIVRLSTYFKDPNNFTTPAECFGDIGAASGPIFACLSVRAGERGYAKGQHYLICTSSEGGERGAAVFDLLLENKKPKGAQIFGVTDTPIT